MVARRIRRPARRRPRAPKNSRASGHWKNHADGLVSSRWATCLSTRAQTQLDTLPSVPATCDPRLGVSAPNSDATLSNAAGALVFSGCSAARERSRPDAQIDA